MSDNEQLCDDRPDGYGYGCHNLTCRNRIRENAYQQGRADAITEAIATIVNTPCTWASHFPQIAQDALVDRQNEIIDMLEELKNEDR